MNKNTKITLKELMARKEQMLEAKKNIKTKDLHVKSLDGVITIQSLEKSVIAEAQEMKSVDADAYAVYQSVIEPPLKAGELQKEFGCVEPLEIVDKIFEPGEISQIAVEILKISGYEVETVTAIDDLKN